MILSNFYTTIVISLCACSSVVERQTDNLEVEGPIPSTRTNHTIGQKGRKIEFTQSRQILLWQNL